MIALSLFLTFILDWSVQAEAASWLVTCEARENAGESEHPETGRGTPRPPHARSGVTFISHDIILNGELFLRLDSPFPRQNWSNKQDKIQLLR